MQDWYCLFRLRDTEHSKPFTADGGLDLKQLHADLSLGARGEGPFSVQYPATAGQFRWIGYTLFARGGEWFPPNHE